MPNPALQPFHFAVVLFRLLLLFLPLAGNTQGADRTNPHWYAELYLGYQSHFGPSEGQAELIGGFDTLSYDRKQHYSPGFKASVPVELGFGWSPNGRFLLEGRLGYFRHDLGLLLSFNREEFHLADADVALFGLAGLFRFPAEQHKIPYALCGGLSATGFYPLQFTLDPDTKTTFGIGQISPGLQVHFSLDGALQLSLGKRGWYAFAKVSVGIPSFRFGALGRFRLQDGSGFTANNQGIKMYSMKGGLGVGRQF